VATSGTALSYKAVASGGSWLSVAPASGFTPGALFVSVNPAGMPAGTYKASIAIAPTDSPGNVQVVPVTLAVSTATNACRVPADDHDD
jgi:hypothetical protein